MNDEAQPRWYSRPGVWFWGAIVLGALIRFYLVVFTDGTEDVAIWERHARDVLDRGLIGYYHGDPSANHPPFISEVEATFLHAADASGIPFRIYLRTPFALLDAGTTFLLVSLLGTCRWRFVAVAAYWLNPLSIIFSAYHGNTDSAVAFFLALCVWLLSKNKLVSAAIALGASLWIKLPAVLAIPALFFFIPDWRKRFQFFFVAGVVALATYVPALVSDPAIVWKNVFGYRGLYVHTTAGVPVWGPTRVLLFQVIAPPDKWPEQTHGALSFLWHYGWKITLALLLLLTWLRRSRRSVQELCATIGMVYTIVYGFSDSFTFQYFAWGAPFWVFLGRWFYFPAFLIASGYIYSLYWLLCGNPWLFGRWDFIGHPYWPPIVTVFRDLAVLFFLISASVYLFVAVKNQLREFTRRDRIPHKASRPDQ